MPYYDTARESRSTRARPKSVELVPPRSRVASRSGPSTEVITRLSTPRQNYGNPEPTWRRSPIEWEELGVGSVFSSVVFLGSREVASGLSRGSPDTCPAASPGLASQQSPRMSPEAIERLATPRQGPTDGERALPADMCFRPKVGLPWGPKGESLLEACTSLFRHECGPSPKSAESRCGGCGNDEAHIFCKRCQQLFCVSCWRTVCYTARLAFEGSPRSEQIKQIRAAQVFDGWMLGAMQKTSRPASERLHEDAQRRKTKGTRVVFKGGPYVVNPAGYHNFDAFGPPPPLPDVKPWPREVAAKRMEELASPRPSPDITDDTIPYLPRATKVPTIEELAGIMLRHKPGTNEHPAEGTCGHEDPYIDREKWNEKNPPCVHCRVRLCKQCRGKPCRHLQVQWDDMVDQDRVQWCLKAGVVNKLTANTMIRSMTPVFARLADFPVEGRSPKNKTKKIAAPKRGSTMTLGHTYDKMHSELDRKLKAVYQAIGAVGKVTRAVRESQSSPCGTSNRTPLGRRSRAASANCEE